MDGIILGIFAFLLKLIFVLIIVVPLYILCAVWETKILKACGYKNTWAAWVPFANMWALAEVSLGNQQFAPLYMANIQLPVRRLCVSQVKALITERVCSRYTSAL